MKFVIAFAAVLTSAVLTVPTVTDLGDSKRSVETRIVASSDAQSTSENA